MGQQRLPDVTLPPFEEVVTRHGQTVLRVCRALLGPENADDAWSETFLAALTAYPQLDPGAHVEAWLVTIAKRKVIDHYRSRTRAPVPLAEPPDEGHDDIHPVDTDSSLWRALSDLPPKQREAVALHHVGGLPYAEVAVLLGNSTDAARRAAADGIKTLRTTYQGDRS